ncbi:MAG: radical SAM protein [Acidimicrobiia bacterium]|nr:radical SAM protein [Acidimicrobiia bacterium]
MEIAFGPVPSRRLGRSLGINNIPPKVCTYACVYCQVGATTDRSLEPRAFYPATEVVERVAERVAAITAAGEAIDYLTFVPDGEPTLDTNLGEAIARLRPLGIPIAVISNASLVWRPEVSAALETADWVSLKVDTVDEAAWRRLNRPHPALRLPEILDGIRRFAARFRGTLASETMLVAGYNDDPARIEATADFLMEAQVAEAHLALPLRPTALPGVTAPGAAAVAEARSIFEERLPQVFYLFTPEEGAFASSGDVGRDLVGICAVHPMREEAVRDLLQRKGATWEVVENLLAGGLLVAKQHEGHTFYTCRPRRRNPAGAPHRATESGD